MRKIIKHHIEGGTRESHPRVQDLLHQRLGKPSRGLQILDTRMGFPRPSLNVVLDSISLKSEENKSREPHSGSRTICLFPAPIPSPMNSEKKTFSNASNTKTFFLKLSKKRSKFIFLQ